MSISSVGVVGQQGQQNPTGTNAFREVELSDFIKLMVTELRNQDPLNPMDNTEILQQMSQIRAIESNDRLSETLQSVLLGQSVVTATSLLQRTIVALSEDGERISGQVDRVSIEDGQARLHVGEHVIDPNNIAEILPEEDGDTQNQGE